MGKCHEGGARTMEVGGCCDVVCLQAFNDEVGERRSERERERERGRSCGVMPWLA